MCKKGDQLCRMVKKPVQQGRRERRGEAYFEPYVESLSDPRTKLAGFFSILPRGVDEAERTMLQGPTY
jgi:hypothetical protein